MAKYRYLVEASGVAFEPWFLSSVDDDGEIVGRHGTFETVDAAKAQAESIATDDSGDRVVLVWKPAPARWQPDAVCASQRLDPMYPDLPT
jgi:hypothetical protein